MAVREPDECLARLRITNEWRRKFDRGRDWSIPAAFVDPRIHTPTCDAPVAGRPAMWSAGTGEFVDADLFTTLKVGDATRIKPGRQVVIGRLRHRAEPRDVAWFLLRAEIVETYWHLYADLCLRAEERDENGYRASFSGVHHYATNSYNQEAYRFALTIAADGVIELSGG